MPHGSGRKSYPGKPGHPAKMPPKNMPPSEKQMDKMMKAAPMMKPKAKPAKRK